MSSQNMMSATTAAAGTVTGCGNNVDEAISVQIRTPRKKISRYKKLIERHYFDVCFVKVLDMAYLSSDGVYT